MSTSREPYQKLFAELKSSLPANSPIRNPDGILGLLLKENTLAQQAQEIKEQLEGKNPVLNPDRETKVTWDKLLSTYQDAMALTIALDRRYSAQYTPVSKNFHESLIALGLTHEIQDTTTDLNNEGESTHVIHEKDSTNYHRSSHTVGCANAAAAVAITPEIKNLVSISFNWHDIVQEYPMIALLNEIESADLLIKKWTEKLETLEKRVNEIFDNKEQKKAFQAIKEYKAILPYIAWKTIVAATTMLKQVSDGQPTLHAVQKNALEKVLQENIIKYTALDQAATLISLVDSNLAALNLREAFGNAVPLAEDFLNSKNEFGIATQLKKLFELAGLPDAPSEEHNKAGFLFGNNMGIFPELAKDYKGLLSYLKFTSHDGEINDIDGVTAWNLLTDASRNGDEATLRRLLTARSRADNTMPRPNDNKMPLEDFIQFNQKTLCDIFIEKIIGEITFASNQHPDVYKTGNGTNQNIDAEYSQKHAARLRKLQENYLKLNPDDPARIAVAEALAFFVVFTSISTIG